VGKLVFVRYSITRVRCYIREHDNLSEEDHMLPVPGVYSITGRLELT
jgi:hypothetical protein